MKNEEILKKAIEKAEKNGYQTPFLEKEVLTIPRNAGKKTSIDIWMKGFVTQLDFAKAFWGEKHRIKDADVWYCANLCGLAPMTLYDKEKDCPHSWQYHLQQMVLEEEPIKYLEKFI